MGGSTQTRAKKTDGFAQERARRNTAAHPHAAKSPRTKILSSVKCSRRTSPAVRTSLYTAPAPYTSYPAARAPCRAQNTLATFLFPPANCGMPRRARDLCSAHKPSRHTENPSADRSLRRGSVFQKIYRRRKPVLPYTSSMITCSAASPRRLPRDTMRV